MAHFEKHKADTNFYIRHITREIPPGKLNGNSEIDPSRTPLNYAIASKGKTAAEIIEYKDTLMEDIYCRRIKDITRSVEVVITLPRDCPPELEKQFFQESYKYVCSTLPLGEKCVLGAYVHKDEGVIMKDGAVVYEGRPHMHMIYVPAARNTPDQIDRRGCEWKLNARDIINPVYCRRFHNDLQKWLDDANIPCSVKTGKTGTNYSINELKAITKETGMSIYQIRDMIATQEVNLLQRDAIEKQVGRLEAQNQQFEQIITDIDNDTERLYEENDMLKNENESLKERIRRIETEYEERQDAMEARSAEEDRLLSQDSDVQIQEAQEIEPEGSSTQDRDYGYTTDIEEDYEL